MSALEIIPAIDIKDGRCVRLYQGDYAQITVFDQDPVDVALKWARLGAQRLHVVDLDGAKAGRPVNAQIVYAIVRAVSIPVQLGGGLRDQSAVDAALNLGVERIILGTAAVRDPQLVGRLVQQYGAQIVVGVDARDGLVAAQGWTETSHVRTEELVRRMGAIGVRSIIYTDIGRDGTLTGPDIEGVSALVQAGGPEIIASGGVARLEDLAALAKTGAAGVIVGKALYTGAFDLPEALEVVRAVAAQQ
ncbi:MAG TPA: 1-(5-phosphoribosyl)-5-[(5-phosphoribosylamino)methylideneamino]imidazole-4-carboxamide isomerase [Herpetosiphonaceae bacterium]